MHFTIITPSLNQLDYLKRCVASVRDQPPSLEASAVKGDEPIRVHHHVQDGGSTDGTVEFLRECQLEVDGGQSEGNRLPNNPASHGGAGSGYSFSFSSEPDRGMYDALNKGIDFVLQSQLDNGLLSDGVQQAAIGDQKLEGGRRKSDNTKRTSNIRLQTSNLDDAVVAWLNCDEQYLPGTLEKVGRYFETHPDVDFVYGNALLLDEDGGLLTYRKNPPLRKWYVQSDHLYTQSCAMFFRERGFRQGFRFDTQWKAVSDCDFMARLLEAGYRPRQVHDYLSVFFMTGGNLSGSEQGMEELRQWRKTMPFGIRALHYPLRILRYLEKSVQGGFRERFPLEYSIYMPDHPGGRKRFCAENGTAKFVSWGR